MSVIVLFVYSVPHKGSRKIANTHDATSNHHNYIRTRKMAVENQLSHIDEQHLL